MKIPHTSTLILHLSISLLLVEAAIHNPHHHQHERSNSIRIRTPQPQPQIAAATTTSPHPLLNTRKTAICGWRCGIQKQIEKIQKQLAWITEQLWSPNPNNPDPTTEPEEGRPEGPSQSPPPGQESTPTPTPIDSSNAEPSSFLPIDNSEPKKPTSSPPPQKPQDTNGETMGGGDGYRSVAYFVNWGIYGRKYTPDKIPIEKLTHILYSFADNRDDGTVFLTDTWSDVEIHYPTDSWNDVGNNLYGNLKQLNLLKRRNRNLKIMLSIGGWTYTNTQKHFDAPAGSPQGRKKFAETCVGLIRDLGFDGIDLDWEYPQNPGQGEQLVLLLKEIRKGMDGYADKLAKYGERPHFELSIAAPAGKTNYDNLPLGKVGEALDFVNIMGYDFSGAWDKAAGHQANLYPSASCPQCTPFNIQSVITDYTGAGIPANKLVLGMPLYGRAFTGTSSLGQAFNGTGEGSWENGIWDYKVLPKPGSVEHIDEESGASYSYDESTQTLITYDTIEMARRKTDYIKQKGLGGAMWWELSGDKDGEGSIISHVFADLGGPDGGKIERKQNNINHPDSVYENLKAGFPNES